MRTHMRIFSIQRDPRNNNTHAEMDDFFCDAPGESKSTVLGAVYIGDVEAGYTRNDMENAGTGKADCWAACDRWDATYQEELGQAG